jgi:hypothetical protein
VTSTDPPAPGTDCSLCGTLPPGRTGRPPICRPCRLTRRLERLLDDGTGTINPALAPLAAQLLADPNADTVLVWLSRPRIAELLSALATGALELTHEALHTWPHHNATRHLRHRLIACGILPSADRSLLDFETWLHHRLATVAGHPHERLLRTFALWHQLPRLRTAAATRPLRATARQYVNGQFTAALAFLTWLQEHDLAPAQITQADLDTWWISHPVHHRQNIRGFLQWAIEHGHLPRHLTIHRVAFKPGQALTQHERLDLLHRYLTDATGPTDARAAACLLLLYAQPLSRIQRLTRDNLVDQAGEPHLRLGEPPVLLPTPVAELLHQLTQDAEQHRTGTAWLFPGRLPGQPIAYRTLLRRLRELGFPIGQARITALRQLVQQAPAPVIADALGFHQTTTTRQVTHAGATWSRYTTGDHQ